METGALICLWRRARGEGLARTGLPAALSSKSSRRECGSQLSFLSSFCLQGKGAGQVVQPFVDQFGFDVVTCCGYLPQVSDTSQPFAFCVPVRSGRLPGEEATSPFVKFRKSLRSLFLLADFEEVDMRFTCLAR